MGVEFNKTWVIRTKEDFDLARERLDQDYFVAEMSDSYAVTRNEQLEIARQLEDVWRQAREIGLVS